MDDAFAHGVRERVAFDRVVIEDDRSIAVVGALGGSAGTVVSLGTGSFAGRVVDGATRLLGGWGFRVADQASGAWLGRALLTRAVLHADEVAPGGPVVAGTAAEFGSALAISRFAMAAMPADYARFAPRVMDGADAGEPDLRAIAREGAAYIAAALRTLGWVEGERLCLVGGVGHRFRPYLDAAHRVALCEPAGTALDGALARAVRLVGMADAA